MEEFKKGNTVFWNRPHVTLLCVVQWVEGDQVALLHPGSPRSEPPFLVNANEIVMLPGQQEKPAPSHVPGILERQKEIYSPQKKTRKKKEKQ